MGLSASQARLLTITARKSDCEFQSMRYSHEKIALSRSMTELSTKYQNSLEQTKLVYDFYGEGDTTTPLSYNLLMTPSQMNGYLPTLITDAAGKTILDSKYAAAARAAGIPQEGLGCLPSSDIRNKFIQGLADNGVIGEQEAITYMGIEYAQEMGMGTTDLVTTKVEQMTLTELLAYQAEQGNLTEYNTSGLSQGSDDSCYSKLVNCKKAGPGVDMDTNSGSATNLIGSEITIIDILEGNYNMLYRTGKDYSYDSRNDKTNEVAGNIKDLNVWDWMFDELEAMINVTGDPNIAGALDYAETMTRKLLDVNNGYGKTLKEKFKEKDEDKEHFQGAMDAMMGYHGSRGSSYNTNDYFGVCKADNKKTGKSDKFASGVSISLTNIAKAFLTYFAQAIQGIGKSEYYVNDTSGRRTVNDSHLIDDQFTFNVVVDTGINTDEGLKSGFYDAVFNQICTRGWVENNEITNNDYMQEMLKTGKFYLATCADDGYYYQGNYATNTYIREISDEEAITKAEAEYNTEKQKLNHKEEVLDLKMKNLDTEMSSLNTEYDTLKSLISKNIEKGFKRYDA